jgi:cytochrome c oxidase subunit I
LVPAHYHASLGAVTVAFMAAAYFVCALARRDTRAAGLRASVWRAAKWQLALFGVGQTVFALGFALGGVYGLGRKAYAAEQHVRSAGELTGLLVMGLGGLVAVAGGLWFLFLILRELRAWWRPAAARPANAFALTTL